MLYYRFTYYNIVQTNQLRETRGLSSSKFRQASSLAVVVALLFDVQMTGRIKDAESAQEPSAGPLWEQMKPGAFWEKSKG